MSLLWRLHLSLSLSPDTAPNADAWSTFLQLFPLDLRPLVVPVFCNGEFTTTRQHEEEIRDFVLNLVGCETADGTDGVENGGFNFDFTEL